MNQTKLKEMTYEERREYYQNTSHALPRRKKARFLERMTERYCEQCGVDIHLLYQTAIYCGKCRIERHHAHAHSKFMEAKRIREAKRIKPHLPDATPAQACKIVQCDPSVRYFEINILSHYPQFIRYKDAIIEDIRKVNKRMHEKLLFHTANIIVAVAILNYYGKNHYKLSQVQAGVICECSTVTLRSFIKDLRLPLLRNDTEY